MIRGYPRKRQLGSVQRIMYLVPHIQVIFLAPAVTVWARMCVSAGDQHVSLRVYVGACACVIAMPLEPKTLLSSFLWHYHVCVFVWGGLCVFVCERKADLSHTPTHTQTHGSSVKCVVMSSLWEVGLRLKLRRSPSKTHCLAVTHKHTCMHTRSYTAQHFSHPEVLSLCPIPFSCFAILDFPGS